MKEIKSKKTGKAHIVSEEEYAEMINSNFDMKRFTVTDMSVRSIIPSIIKEVKEVKEKKPNKKT